MEKNMRFGLILGQLAILEKKVWADYEQILRAFFSCFHTQKKLFCVRTKKLLNTRYILCVKMKVKKSKSLSLYKF